MWYFLLGYIFILSFLLSVLFVPIVMKLAWRWNIVDNPGTRKIHMTPKPLMGGISFYLSFNLVVLAHVFSLLLLQNQLWVQQWLPLAVKQIPRLNLVLPRLMLLLSCGTILLIVGLLDDILKEKFSYKWKFVGQFIAALILVFGGIRTEFMPFEFLDIVISILWIIGITNSFNLLDNMDGLSAGVALIAALIFFFVTLFQLQIFMAFILIALAGSVLGFLIYNFKPAKLFMGDSGSLFLGFMFGTLTILGSYKVPQSQSLLPVVMPVLILSMPLYDTFSVIFIRLKEKRPLFKGDTRHFSHRLVALGFSEKETVLFIYLVTFCVGIGASLLPYIPLWGNLVVLIQTVTIYMLITVLMIISMKNR